jgi:hypothetical protein
VSCGLSLCLKGMGECQNFCVRGVFSLAPDLGE